MKATSIFGGVQFFNIIIQIVRSKFVAVLLGPKGMGIMGLLISTTGMIGSITNFGLGTSAVKDIAAAFGTNNLNRVAILVNVMRRLVWITGLIGLIITAIFSRFLSQVTFGNKDYAIAFLWLSITLLLNQLSSGQLVLLQGMRKLKHLAQANLSGSFLGLFVTLPLYYIWGFDGIVPGVIGTSLLSLLMSWYYSRKIKIEHKPVSFTQTITEGKNMLYLGFMINLSMLFSVASSYLVRIFISHTGGIDQVGLYNAGFVIINTYVGLIFNAMGTDYFPRLSAVAYDNNLCKQTINQQAEIALLILAPILIIFLIFINWVIILLYSKQFIAVTDMIYWAAMGMFFKAASWSISFLFLAKGSSKVFFWTELSANILILGLNILGYYLGGLSGLGISFAIYYLIYLIQVFLTSKIKFGFSFNLSFIQIFAFQYGLALLGYCVVKYFGEPKQYLIGSVVIVISLIYSVWELNKRLNIFDIQKIIQRQ
jgi:O-antigen/teichoic acid export membrane protein